MTTPKQPTRQTPFGRVAGSRYLATKPMLFLDSGQSTRRRVRSFLWFASGGWRSAVVRPVARLVLNTADGVLAKRSAGSKG